MNKIFKETLWNIKNTKVVSAIIIILFSICTAIGTYSINSYIQTNEQNKIFTEKYTEKNYYKLSDNFVGEEGEKFERSVNKYTKLLAFNHILANNEDFEYLEVYSNPIDVSDFKGSEVFKYLYETGGTPEGDANLPKKITTVKGIYLSENVFDEFGIEIEQGSMFSSSDYLLNDDKYNSDIIPIIVGNEYKDYYNVGDYIKMQYNILNPNQGGASLKIIGILKEGSVIKRENDRLESLDRYIIQPSYDIKDVTLSENSTSLFEIMLYMKTNGVIITGSSANEVQDRIAEICTSVDIFPIHNIMGATNQRTRFFNIDLQKITTFFYIISITVLSLTAFLMILFSIMAVKRNLKYYAILLTCGYSFGDIMLMFILQPLILCSVAYFIGSIISIIIIRINYYLMPPLMPYIVFAIAMFIISFLSAMLAKNELKKHDLSMYLRKK